MPSLSYIFLVERLDSFRSFEELQSVMHHIRGLGYDGVELNLTPHRAFEISFQIFVQLLLDKKLPMGGLVSQRYHPSTMANELCGKSLGFEHIANLVLVFAMAELLSNSPRLAYQDQTATVSVQKVRLQSEGTLGGPYAACPHPHKRELSSPQRSRAAFARSQ